jgi:hypothetical protein
MPDGSGQRQRRTPPDQQRLPLPGAREVAASVAIALEAWIAAPILLGLASYRWRRRVLNLEPVVDAAGPVWRTEPLRDDPLAAERAGVLEDVGK